METVMDDVAYFKGFTFVEAILHFIQFMGCANTLELVVYTAICIDNH